MFYKIFLFILSVSVIKINEVAAVDKFCVLREQIYPRIIWQQQTGFACYYYTNDWRLSFIYNVTKVHYNNHTIYSSWTDNDRTDYFWYDVLNQTSTDLVRLSFKTDVYYKKWQTCALDAIECCDSFMDDTNIISSDEYPCQATWDGWSCFHPTKADNVQSVNCPSVTYSAESACTLTASKQCFLNGTWNQQTNYETCSILPTNLKRVKFQIIVLCVATVFAFPAICILFSYADLRNTLRFILHRNLLIVITIRNLLTVSVKQFIMLGYLESTSNIMENNGVGCRTVAFFENVSNNGIFACMLLDGYYLHRLLVRPFSSEPRLSLIYLIIMIFSFMPSLIWAILRGVHKGASCWLIDDTYDYWVTHGIRIFILSVNFILLLDIIRVLLMKLRHEPISQQLRTTIRATLFLIPLFGLHIIITSNRGMVVNDTCAAEDAYYYTSYIFEAAQGIMVALLFCYINFEVKDLILNSIRKLMTLKQSKDDSKTKMYKRRSTAMTIVTSDKN